MFRSFSKTLTSTIRAQAMLKRQFGSVVELSSAEHWEELMQEKKSYVVDFYADWCGPCKELVPKLEERAKKASDKTTLLKVNVDSFGDLAGAFNVSTIPHVVLIKD